MSAFKVYVLLSLSPRFKEVLSAHEMMRAYRRGRADFMGHRLHGGGGRGEHPGCGYRCWAAGSRGTHVMCTHGQSQSRINGSRSLLPLLGLLNFKDMKYCL